MNFRFLLLPMIVLLLSACSANKPPRLSAEKYFQEGESYFENGLYEDAIASWEKVRDSYYSPELNKLAELKIAETYYVSQRYLEASTAYADFLKHHPNDRRTATVMYRLGLSYYQQILSADRDQTNTENALRIFKEFRQRFPENPQTAVIDDLIQRCLNRLAEHEVYVGWFYQRTEKYQAAIKRLEQALEKYPNFPARDEAYFYLGRSYLKIGEKAKGKQNLQQLLDQFPGSEYRDDAQKLLAED